MIEIFTDGASRGNPGLSACGYNLVTENGEIISSVTVYEKSTNNRMEVLAISNALNFCINHDWVDKEIKLYSDSAWAIGAVSKNWNISCNLDLVDRARSYLSKFTNIKSIKVKGHADNEGNISIDTLLNKAMDNPEIIYKDVEFEGGN